MGKLPGGSPSSDSVSFLADLGLSSSNNSLVAGLERGISDMKSKSFSSTERQWEKDGGFGDLDLNPSPAAISLQEVVQETQPCWVRVPSL